MKALTVLGIPYILVLVMGLTTTNAPGQTASALQRNAVEKASPFSNVEPATGAASVWHPVQSPSAVAPKANSAVQAAPLMSRVKPSFTINTPPLVMTGVLLNVATPQLTFTGLQSELTTPALSLTGLQIQVVTDRLILVGKK
jgi:hypothetical protein